MTNPREIFSRFTTDDFEVIHIDHLLKEGGSFRPIDIAQAVVNASQEAKKPVNFRLRTEQEYWTNWTVIGGHGRSLLAALDYLGYRTAYQTNPTSDGFYLHLEKKPIPSDIPSQPRL